MPLASSPDYAPPCWRWFSFPWLWLTIPCGFTRGQNAAPISQGSPHPRGSSVGSGSPEWQERLNEVNGKLWPRVDGGERLRMRIIHPMDTGLAAGIPAFHIEDIVIADAEGRTLSRIQPLEPVAENPSFTLDFAAAAPGTRVHVGGRDNNGNRIDAWVTR